jgi:hypothetical protein
MSETEDREEREGLDVLVGVAIRFPEQKEARLP